MIWFCWENIHLTVWQLYVTDLNNVIIGHILNELEIQIAQYPSC